AAMLGGARNDPILAKALGERWLAPRQKWGFEKMSQAIAIGQCRVGIDVGAALGILYGPLYAPLLFGRPMPSRKQLTAH
ncbi:TetR-like C-terminal domain-containing protein, partial [Acinetobacter baumannii]